MLPWSNFCWDQMMGVNSTEEWAAVVSPCVHGSGSAAAACRRGGRAGLTIWSFGTQRPFSSMTGLLPDIRKLLLIVIVLPTDIMESSTMLPGPSLPLLWSHDARLTASPDRAMLPSPGCVGTKNSHGEQGAISAI